MKIINHSPISPGILYHNAPAMIDWLCGAFGFVTKTLIGGAKNTVVHAYLVLGTGGIMISSAEIHQEVVLCKSPKDVGIGTVEIIVYVKEVDEHYKNAKEHGAEIVIDLEEKPYGGRSYCCKDPEGHVWVFSSYDPWAQENL